MRLWFSMILKRNSNLSKGYVLKWKWNIRIQNTIIWRCSVIFNRLYSQENSFSKVIFYKLNVSPYFVAKIPKMSQSSIFNNFGRLCFWSFLQFGSYMEICENKEIWAFLCKLVSHRIEPPLTDFMSLVSF